MLLVQGEIQIHNLNKNPLAIIPLGKAKLTLGYVRIIQPIDLTQIHDIITKFDELVRTNVYNNNLYRLLQNRNHLLYQTYLKIAPHNNSQSRIKRWDTIGKILKWVAGTPDAEDLSIINNTMNALIDNNNQQTFINEAINSRIKHLNQVTNELLELDFKSQKQHVIEINLLTILLNLNAAQHQIEILEDALLLAKNGIPSSQILSMKDYSKIKYFLQQQNIPVTSFEEMLTKTSTQIAMNNTHVMYMLKIPQLSNETYNYEFISPLIQNQTKIHIESSYIITNESHTFETSAPCKEDSEYFLCESKLIKPTSPCIRNLILSRHANCTFEKVYSSGVINRINDATLLLNNVNISLYTNCSNSSKLLEGSFLIHFEQCELYLDNIRYTNIFMETPKTSFRPTTGILAYKENIIDVPPPEYLANLTLEHRRILKHVYLQNHSFKWKLYIFGSITITTFTLIIAAIIVYVLVLKRQAKKTQIEINLHKQENPSAPEGIQIKSPYPDVSDERLQQINNYLRMPTADRSIRL